MAKSTRGKGGRTGPGGARAGRSESSKAPRRDSGAADKGASAKASPPATKASAPADPPAAPPGQPATGLGGSRPASPRSRPAPTKRTTPSASSRYTPPVPRAEKVSPIWVPIVMFACLGLGMVIIITNYVNLLPGPDPSNTYLMIGLGLITLGFITATRYH